MAAVVLSLVPTPLFEIRYFNPIIVIAMLSMSPLTLQNTAIVEVDSGGKNGENLAEKKEQKFPLNIGTAYYVNLYMIIFAFCIINLITVYVFLHKPFQWNGGTVARFMY